MKKMELLKRTADLDLFLAKIDYVPFPEPYASIFKRNKEAEKKKDEKLEKLEQALEEAKSPITMAWLKSLGLTHEDMQKVLSAEEKALTEYPMTTEYPTVVPPTVVVVLPEEGQLCEWVTTWECQHKVCVDNPVPVSVDDGYDDCEGTFEWVREYDRFKLNDTRYGREWWDLGGHHERTRTHRGEVRVFMGRRLMAESKVRDVGVYCSPLSTGSNGYNANGDHGTLEVGTDWGRVKEWSYFQVRSTTPGSSVIYHVPWSQYKSLDVDYYSDSGPHVGPYYIPRERAVDINQTFPEGTDFYIEWGLEYEVKGRGDEGYGHIAHSLQVNPWMNLEACRWEW